MALHTVYSKTYSGKFEIILERREGKVRVPGKREWQFTRRTKTCVKGISQDSVRFFKYNDFGNIYVSFSLDYLSEDDFKFLLEKIPTEKMAEVEKEKGNYGEYECMLFDYSGLLKELATAYSDWYGIEVSDGC